MNYKINNVSMALMREPLKQPFGFKGGYLSELWQTICGISADNNEYGIGTGVQSVLWSDEKVFCSHTQTGGNALMLAVTEHALSMLKGIDFQNPIQVQHEIEDELYRYACSITDNQQLAKTFMLNALVPVDFALWQLWAKCEHVDKFDGLVEAFCPQMNLHHDKLGAIPLISYNTSSDDIAALLENGSFILKIKIGSNPDGNNNLDEMCQWDIKRLSQIHKIASGFDTPYTDCKHPVYYIDANGRYDTKDRLNRFLDGVDKCGALERIILLEEPFPEKQNTPVYDIPVRIAGDESVHSVDDAIRCIDGLGYRAITLKPIAKTLSASLEIYKEAYKRSVPCFCADLTVPPLMLDWNMNVAARIGVLPGLKIGVVETNGAQNYKNWDQLCSMHPYPNAPWLRLDRGVFSLKDFYNSCAVFSTPEAYAAVLSSQGHR